MKLSAFLNDIGMGGAVNDGDDDDAELVMEIDGIILPVTAVVEDADARVITLAVTLPDPPHFAAEHVDAALEKPITADPEYR